MPAVPDTTLEMLTSEPYFLTMKDAKTILSLDDGLRLDYYLEVMDELLRHDLSPDSQVNIPSHTSIDSLQSTIGKTAGNW